ncbi:MAG TPA: SpvB/TcaC N-terminal domain-containing protein, partial [Anaerolineales bacterium]|nr:SpvB/TcaC N-terminal domain-containing protein [Anaerolineales bacterium]
MLPNTQKNPQSDTKAQQDQSFAVSPPSINLPKGGGAIRGIGEKFAANPVTGTGSMSVPIATSPGRSGFGPQLSLSYDSGSGNGPFGFGWSLSLPSITRKTDKGLPRYLDVRESDTFILSGAEDLVPVMVRRNGRWIRQEFDRAVNGVNYRIQRYRPRIEGLFARIERWTNMQTGEIHWRSISRDNIITLYGKTKESRIADPADPLRVFRWLICESYDDKGNAIAYGYKLENSEGIDVWQAHERNRTEFSRSANRYLKRIKYGNRVSRLIEPDVARGGWHFEVVFDYGEHDLDTPTPDETKEWLCRHDAFSSYRATFEVRTYRLCQRVLMFHHFPEEEEVGADCLVRSTDFVYRNIRENEEDLRKGHPVASFIASVTQSGYRRKGDSYLKRSLPPLEFEYSQAIVHEAIQEIDSQSLENLPIGL